MTADELIIRYTLEDRFSSRARVIDQSARQTAGALTGIRGALDKVAVAPFEFIGSALQSVLRYVTYGITAAIAAIGGLAVSSLGAAAELDGLKRGLTAVMGSSEAMTAELEKLKEVAKLPGLGFREAVEGSTRLQAAGLSADTARAALMAFGNAIATVGGGKEELDAVQRALGQIAASSHVMGQDILQLTQALPQIRQAMKAAFGTADTEQLAKMGIAPEQFIKGLITQFEKLPKVTGGIKNAFENMSDAWFRFRAAIGEGLARFVIPLMDNLGAAIQNIAESGALDKIFSGFQKIFSADWLSSELIGAINWIVAALEHAPEIVTVFESGFRKALTAIGSVAKIVIGILGVLWGHRFVFAISKVVSAIYKLILKIRELGIVAAISEAIASGGMSVVQAVVSGIVAAIATIGLFELFDSGMPDFSEEIGKLRTIGNSIQRDADNLTKKLKEENEKADKENKEKAEKEKNKKDDDATKNQPPAVKTPTISPDGSVGGRISSIANNTKQIAENTSPENLQRYAIGGGDIGRVGLEYGEVKRSFRKDPEIKITGGTEMERLIGGFVIDAIRQLKQQGWKIERVGA